MVVAVDGIAAEDMRKTLQYITDTTPGKKIVLEVNRNNTLLKIQVDVAELKSGV